MSVFEDERATDKRPPMKKTPWPIKLAMKAGAKDERQANILVVVVSVILIVITVMMYKNNSTDQSSNGLLPSEAQLIN